MRAIYETKGKAREYFELAINLFGGCGHACSYCYGADVTRQDWDSFVNRPQPRRGIIEAIERDARRIAGKEKRPILMCFVTDPYQPIEAATQITRQAIKILKRNKLRVAILSKGGQRAVRDLDLLDNKDWFGTTLTLLDEGQSKKWEPLAATPNERIAALEEAHRRGVSTWVSCEPVIDPAQTLRLIDLTSQYVDCYKVGKMNYTKVDVNWQRFAWSAMDLLSGLGKRYYIKKDLAAFVGRPEGIDRGKCN